MRTLAILISGLRAQTILSLNVMPSVLWGGTLLWAWWFPFNSLGGVSPRPPSELDSVIVSQLISLRF